jgi:pyruvate,water dikinase
MRLIAQLDDLRRDDIALAGGKGANLGELTRAGVRVPPGFVITADAYSSFLDAAGIRARLDQLLAGIGSDPAIDGAAADLQGLITSTPFPDDLAAAVASAYSGLGGGAVAVRSSATAEDLPDASFAGQQSTFLNVEGEAAVMEAVRECWASLFEPRAMHYRSQHGYNHQAVAIAVVVQQMIESERSGVMFTLNPITGDTSSMVVEAIFGLGEAVVSGVVTPDMYFVDKATGAVTESQVSAQEQEMVRNPDARPGGDPNHWLPVAFDRRARPKLTDGEIAEIARSGVAIEQHFGCPQDIEWAYAGGSFYIVQARPVTAAG